MTHSSFPGGVSIVPFPRPIARESCHDPAPPASMADETTKTEMTETAQFLGRGDRAGVRFPRAPRPGFPIPPTPRRRRQGAPGQSLRARRDVRAYGVDGSNAIRFGFSREIPGAPPTLLQPVRHRKVLHAKCLRTDHLVLIGRCSPSTDRHGCSKRKSARTRLNKSGCSMWAPWAQPGRMQRRAFGIPSHRTTESEGLVERSISPTTTKVGIFNS